MALEAVGAAWLVEQPGSSLAWFHPRLRCILRSFPKVRSFDALWTWTICCNIEYYFLSKLGQKKYRVFIWFNWFYIYGLDDYAWLHESIFILYIKYINNSCSESIQNPIFVYRGLDFLPLLNYCWSFYGTPWQIYTCRWWMGHYMSCTPKRHICWSNCRKIGGLDKGKLSEAQRQEIRSTGVKSASVKVNNKGRKVYTGTSKLRATG